MKPNQKKSPTGCCPKFNPKPWNEQKIVWKGKLFCKDRVKSLFHIPVNFGSVITRNMKLIDKEKALSPEIIVLSDENSLFGSDMYIAVTKEVPGAKMAKISGTFLTKVYEGPYKDMGKWINDMKEYVKSKGKNIKKMYFFYTTCPKCAKAYGKNYVVILAQI